MRKFWLLWQSRRRILLFFLMSKLACERELEERLDNISIWLGEFYFCTEFPSGRCFRYSWLMAINWRTIRYAELLIHSLRLFWFWNLNIGTNKYGKLYSPKSLVLLSNNRDIKYSKQMGQLELGRWLTNWCAIISPLFFFKIHRLTISSMCRDLCCKIENRPTFIWARYLKISKNEIVNKDAVCRFWS